MSSDKAMKTGIKCSCPLKELKCCRSMDLNKPLKSMEKNGSYTTIVSTGILGRAIYLRTQWAKDQVDGYREKSITCIGAAVTTTVITEPYSANLSHYLDPYSAVFGASKNYC